MHSKSIRGFIINRKAVGPVCNVTNGGLNYSDCQSPTSFLTQHILKRRITPMSNIYHNIICSYIDHGFAPIPVRYKAKHPAIEGWTKLKIEKSDIETYFEEPCNIGILTGKPSNGLVDVDIDDSDALRFAPYFLPDTFFIFGRAL